MLHIRTGVPLTEQYLHLAVVMPAISLSPRGDDNFGAEGTRGTCSTSTGLELRFAPSRAGDCGLT